MFTVLRLRQTENVVYECYQFSCCTVRNSIFTTATVKSVFLVKAFPNFMCDIPFCDSDMNE